MTTIDSDEAEHYLALSTDELYLLLVPEEMKQQGYSTEGLTARGRTIFADILHRTRTSICKQYNRRRESVKNSLDLTVLVASVLVTIPYTGGIPVLPAAALIVKIGLDELCREKVDPV